jgi:hypothetical protein
MHEAFIIVAVILFLLDAVLWWTPNAPWGGRLIPVGLAFFAASFLAAVNTR